MYLQELGASDAHFFAGKGWCKTIPGATWVCSVCSTKAIQIRAGKTTRT